MARQVLHTYANDHRSSGGKRDKSTAINLLSTGTRGGRRPVCFPTYVHILCANEQRSFVSILCVKTRYLRLDSHVAVVRLGLRLSTSWIFFALLECWGWVARLWTRYVISPGGKSICLKVTSRINITLLGF